MMVYRDSKNRSLKWVLALIVFLLAISVTWSDVYGDETNTIGSKDSNQRWYKDTPPPPQHEDPGIENGGNERPPAAVPEPATLILLGGGLSAMYLARKRRKKTV